MLSIALIVAVVLIVSVAMRFAEGDNPDNAITHHSDDDPPDPGSGDGPGDVLLAA